MTHPFLRRWAVPENSPPALLPRVLRKWSVRWSPGELNSEEQAPRARWGDLGGQRWQLRTKPGGVPGDRGPGSPVPVPGWPGFWINAQEAGDALGQMAELRHFESWKRALIHAGNPSLAQAHTVGTVLVLRPQVPPQCGWGVAPVPSVLPVGLKRGGLPDLTPPPCGQPPVWAHVWPAPPGPCLVPCRPEPQSTDQGRGCPSAVPAVQGPSEPWPSAQGLCLHAHTPAVLLSCAA